MLLPIIIIVLIIIFLSLLFSAGIFIRYTYPIMAAVPLLLALAYCTPERE